MKAVDGHAKTVRDLLQGKRYLIDYYQRDYRWQEKQVEELLGDLVEHFKDSYTEAHSRKMVKQYGHYFLGSLVLSQRDGDTYIVDGQQRLTTLTLLMIALHRRQEGKSDRVKLDDLIYSEQYGERSFNIHVEERLSAMDALFRGQSPDSEDAPESVRTICARYEEIQEYLAQEIDERALPYFCDWLIENVSLVEIVAATDEDAYSVFETMNDRGLSLTPLEMLKGHLLSRIDDREERSKAERTWRGRVEALRRLGRDQDTDAVKSWLRARYAKTVRERRQGAENQDFEKIGTEFHRWVANGGAVDLKNSDSFAHFINRDMDFYTRQYERLVKASRASVKGLEPVYHVACFGFTLQYPLLLAALLPDDTDDVLVRKSRVVATYLDITLARRATNYLSMTYGAMSYAVFLAMRDIRGRSLPDIAAILRKRLDDQGCGFNGTSDGSRSGLASFGLNQWSKRYIKVLLARMTAWVGEQSGENTGVDSYMVGGPHRYEIEHIWADDVAQHEGEFASQYEFSEERNRFGGLLLLPKKDNASYGDLPYHKKLPHYLKQNLLVRSLHQHCYDRSPGFVQFKASSSLPFEPHDSFGREELKKRGKLYQAVMERLWDPDRLQREAGTP